MNLLKTIITKFPNSPFGQEAKQQLQKLKSLHKDSEQKKIFSVIDIKCSSTQT